MDNIKDKEIDDLEYDLLQRAIKGGEFKVYIWEENSGNIQDSEELSLIILRSGEIDSILKNKGATARVNRNTMLFLYLSEH